MHSPLYPGFELAFSVLLLALETKDELEQIGSQEARQLDNYPLSYSTRKGVWLDAATLESLVVMLGKQLEILTALQAAGIQLQLQLIEVEKQATCPKPTDVQ